MEQTWHLVLSRHWEQLALQSRQCALLRYLPATHPGAQVVELVKRYPSLHPWHSEIFDPVQVVQAELQTAHCLLTWFPYCPAGHCPTHCWFKRNPVEQVSQVVALEQVLQLDEQALQLPLAE